jgi:hypothetical protein
MITEQRRSKHYKEQEERVSMCELDDMITIY